MSHNDKHQVSKTNMSEQDVFDLTDNLSDYKIIVISNREPYEHYFEGEDIKWKRSSGGLVTALDPLLRASEGTWIAWGSSSADPLMTDSKIRIQVPPESPTYTLKRVWLTDELINGYYYGFSNKILWPLSHNALKNRNLMKIFGYITTMLINYLPSQ